MNATELAETLFPSLCRIIAVEPDSLPIEVSHDSASSMVTVFPQKGEVGSLIGKSGATFKAFSLLAKLISARHSWTIVYCVDSDRDGVKPVATKLKSPKPWDKKETEALLHSLLKAFLFEPVTVTSVDTTKKTTFQVVLDEEEPRHPMSREVSAVLPGGTTDEAVSTALNTIFTAIGSMCRHEIKIVYVRPRPEAQPHSADGRYSKAL